MKQKLLHPASWFLIGLAIGILTRLTDFLPPGIWGIQSVATLFGFWIVSVVIIILLCPSAKKACLLVFLYLFGMTLSFYLSKYLLGLFLLRFSGPFSWNLFFFYSIFSIGCAGIGFGLWFWNQGGKLGSVLRGLPIGGLLAETIGLGFYFGLHHTYLFQLLFDFVFVLLFGIAFFRKSQSKVLYLLTVFLLASIGYFFFYAPFLLIP